jgi:hypothetical protein
MTERNTLAAAASTVEALIYDVRTRGLAALVDRSRFTDLSRRQIGETCRRLALRCPACPGGVPQSIIDRVMRVWGRSR